MPDQGILADVLAALQEAMEEGVWAHLDHDEAAMLLREVGRLQDELQLRGERAERAEAVIARLVADLTILRGESTELCDCYDYAVQLLGAVAPQCVALPTLAGVLMQLDNYTVGQCSAVARLQAIIARMDPELLRRAAGHVAATCVDDCLDITRCLSLAIKRQGPTRCGADAASLRALADAMEEAK